MTEVKYYHFAEIRVHKGSDIPAWLKLYDDVEAYLKAHVGRHTIPEIAKAVNAEEQAVAEVLEESLCRIEHPRVLIASDEGERYFGNSKKAMGAELPRFSNKTEFYHLCWR